jgi:hypothetical protein
MPGRPVEKCRVGKVTGRERVRWRAHHSIPHLDNYGGHGAAAPLPTLRLPTCVTVCLVKRQPLQGGFSCAHWPGSSSLSQ